MKVKVKLQVNENCAMCGICYTQYPDYFSENDEGKAVIKNAVVLLEAGKDTEIEQLCPAHAISVSKEEKNFKQILAEKLEELKQCSIKYPTEREIPFKKEEYFVSLPSAAGEYRYDYSSDRSANSAARSEFERKMYSRIDVIILEILADYRAKYIKPYYSRDEADQSVYAASNKKVVKLLSEIAFILKQEGLTDDLPQDFADVRIFPDENDLIWKMLNKGELISNEMVAAIRSEFDSSSYTSLSSYETYWDTDDMEVMVGTGFGGKMKFKDKYCYKNLRGAFEELKKDILSSCHYSRDDIESRAQEVVKGLIDQYNVKLENAIRSRIQYVDKKVGKVKAKSPK